MSSIDFSVISLTYNSIGIAVEKTVMLFDWYYFSESNGTLTTFSRIITIITVAGTKKRKKRKK